MLLIGLDRVLRRRLSTAVEPLGIPLPAYGPRPPRARRLERTTRAPVLVTPQSMLGADAARRAGLRASRDDPDHGRIILTSRNGTTILERCDRAVDEVSARCSGADSTSSRICATPLECGRALEQGSSRTDVPSSSAALRRRRRIPLECGGPISDAHRQPAPRADARWQRDDREPTSSSSERSPRCR